MRRYLNYLKYIIRHKWFVLIAFRKISISLPYPIGRESWWLAIIHDWSKFRPSEWFPYAKCFYKSDGSKQYCETELFKIAWNHHQKRNKHHWQYWLITWDRGNTEPLFIPDKYVLEMIADWMGAGRAITGKWEVKEWYSKNKENIKLDNNTRRIIENIFDRMEG